MTLAKITAEEMLVLIKRDCLKNQKEVGLGNVWAYEQGLNDAYNDIFTTIEAWERDK